MEKEQNFGCKMHHRVFFSKKEAMAHLKEKCHPENIIPLKGEDLIGRMSYNIMSASMEASNLSEKEKEGIRQAFCW